jgi:serine/threonine-protein phosphatase 6 regulatory ankyrin repeat subunit B
MKISKPFDKKSLKTHTYFIRQYKNLSIKGHIGQGKAVSMQKRLLLCVIIINLAATQCMPMAAVRSFLSRHTPTVLHAVKKAPTVFAHAARNHKVLSASLALGSTVIAIPQTRRAMSRCINSALNLCLFNAAQKGYVQMVKILLKTGIDINQQDSLGFTALHWAAYYGHQAVVESLLANGANIGLASNTGTTALYWAALNGRQAVVELLLAHGANPNIADNTGTTALYLAALNGRQAVVESLLAHGANPNIADNSGATALYVAAAQGHQAMFELLLAHGVDINQQDPLGRAALHRAAEQGLQPVVKLLLSHGADIALQTTGGRTAEDFASTDEIRNYLRLTADLKSAVEREDVPAVRQLVAQGASTLIADQDGNTLIHRVIREYNPNEPTVHDEIARTLMRAAPRQAARVRNRCGQTLLHSAAACGNMRIARYLLSHGAEVNAQDGRGNTALHRFRTKRMRDLLLLEYHADPTIMNHERHVPMANYPDAWYDLIDVQAQQ